MSAMALETVDLGKRYAAKWALQGCTLSIPAGRVAALVGPNGAGKTTLLHLAIGLARPTTGDVRVLGRSPVADAARVLPQIGFVAQEHPLHRGFTVGELLTMGRKLNRRFDDAFARRRLDELGLPRERKASSLSGGEQAQVALTLALAKRPQFLLLDEPVASLDPLARRDFLQVLMESVAEDGISVLLSSHILADLEQVCDYLVIVSASELQVAGEIEQILASHRLLIGPRTDAAQLKGVHEVVSELHSERQTTLLVRAKGHLFDSSWQVDDVSLEEIVLAYLGQPRRAAQAAMIAPGVAS